MIRPAKVEDLDALVALAESTGVFHESEAELLYNVLYDLFHDLAEDTDRCDKLVEDGVITGFVYFGPNMIADGTWDLWWIVVGSAGQGKGRGGRLLRHAEDIAKTNGGRLMFLDTSSLPEYEPTRRFYEKHGYSQEAVLREFFAPGDDKVIFRKVLT